SSFLLLSFSIILPYLIVDLKLCNRTTENFGNKYFSLDNAKKIDAIREKIELYDDINNREKPGIQYLSSRLRTHIYSLLSFVGWILVFHQVFSQHKDCFLLR
ncbi:hypothetical protein, partial [Enterococcus faecium]|uniref:hypothetical protein n=1 Tax=Enterococcus faecium TaxID=1352 RepID=UPI003CC6FC53